MRCPYPRFVRPSASDNNPFPTGIEVPCGKCYACRLKKTDMWIDRIEMEQRCHDSSALFLTLTYSNENLFVNSKGCNSVYLPHMQNFFKSIRQAYRGHTLRYVYLGEYGGRTARPHYHAIIFGVPKALPRVIQTRMQKYWPHGHIRVSAVNKRRIAYIASYHIHSSEYPPGSNKPFSQYSRRPGIGYGYTQEDKFRRAHIPINGDIESITANSLRYVRFSGEQRPLPPYIRKILFPIPASELPIPETVPFALYVKEISKGSLSPTQDTTQIVDNLRSYQSLLHKRSIQKHGKYLYVQPEREG